jgi:hypothetical protein
MVDNSTNINKKRATTSRFNSLNIKKTMTNDVGNPGPGLGQALLLILVELSTITVKTKMQFPLISMLF